MLEIVKKIVGSKNDRELKRLAPAVDRVNAVEPMIHGLSDQALIGKTDELRARCRSGESLDTLLPEAFAVVREDPAACWGCGTSTCN